LNEWRVRHPHFASREEKIRPRGLRSFEQQDHKWFLRLVPGGKDDLGLPHSIRFWKERIEECGADRPPLKVGLLYGPSGCGKSSLIKAGLLPKLAKSVEPVYLEASSDRTEAELMAAVRSKVQSLPGGLSLSETLTHLRMRPELLAGRKLVLFLDQFEQWLNTRRGDQEGELVNALRCCDGEHLQALLMVRDDFWLLVHRFLDSLNVKIEQDINMQKADLFDLKHARRVLAEYGRAYGRLPEDLGALDPKQEKFLDRSLDIIKASQDKVVSVQIAIFSQMLKGREWTLQTLNELGGAEGVGVSFLKENFDQRSANPSHQKHRQAAMSVLRRLLPPSGTDIRGHSQPVGELQRAAAYDSRPSDFEELMRILDKDLLIVTPTEGAKAEEPLGQSAESAARYQLTHDYLVPSLRIWLTMRQRQTVKGRAVLCLEERAEEWKTTRQNRFLPSPLEHLRISCFVRKRNLNQIQKSLLRAADLFYGMWAAMWAIPILILAAFLWLLWDDSQNARAEKLIHDVVNSHSEALPYALEQLRPFQGRAAEGLGQIVETGLLDNKQTSPQQRLHAALALADFGDVRDAFLLDHLAAASTGQCSNIVHHLNLKRESVLKLIEKRLEQTVPEQQRDRLERARLATVALHLDKVETARQALALTNSAVRAAFIDDFRQWHGDLTEVARVLHEVRERRDYDAFGSTLCAALALTPVDTLSKSEYTDLSKALDDLYKNSPDGGTHSAALTALTIWGAQPQSANFLPTRAQPPKMGWYVNTLGMTMIRIPDGEFLMGGDPNSPLEEQPQHRVKLTAPFYVSDREVTVEWFTNFLNDPVYPAEGKPTNWEKEPVPEKPECPVRRVSWHHAIQFCNWLSWREKRRHCYTNRIENGKSLWKWEPEADGYRLPTEAQWEYACRAGSKEAYTFGDDDRFFGEYGYYVVNSKYKPRPAAAKLPNAWGLFNVHGNVWEWCWDFYGENYYKESPTENPPGPEGTNTLRIVRGGSIMDMPEKGRCSARIWREPDSRYRDFGFRVVAPESSATVN
jgi:formylglycine-generating enzyme required for sulfatase activity